MNNARRAAKPKPFFGCAIPGQMGTGLAPWLSIGGKLVTTSHNFACAEEKASGCQPGDSLGRIRTGPSPTQLKLSPPTLDSAAVSADRHIRSHGISIYAPGAVKALALSKPWRCPSPGDVKALALSKPWRCPSPGTVQALALSKPWRCPSPGAVQTL
eukprot:74068-Chlamydomonas_euryale.AAC.1